MKRKLLFLTLTAAILFTVGCNEGPMTERAVSIKHRTPGFAYDEAATTSQMSRSTIEFPQEADAANDTGPAPADYTDAERKLIKCANISIRVENLANADDSVTALLKKYDAYAASTNIQEDSRYYSLRVPANHYDIFLAGMDGMGRLINRYESIEDVSLHYYDLEGRLATKKELLKTFQAYLGKAKTIEEILSVEARLSELQYDIEGTGKQLRNLADRVDYATVDLQLYGPVTSAARRGLTFGERIKQLFGGFGGFLSTVAMVLIGIVIYGIPVLLLLGLLFLLLFGKIGLARKLWRLIKS